MPALDGLILALSASALVLAAVALTRGAPAKLSAKVDAAEASFIALRSEWESLHSSVLTTLQSITEERERAIKAQARARSERQRAEAGNGPHNESREQKLARLRRESGVQAF